MKELIKKEITLTASPLTYFFIAFSIMTMIPGYPILVGTFFVCLGIFYTFQFAREYNDILFTALLPVKKSDVVKSKYIFTIGIQMIGFVLNTILTALRITKLNESTVYATNPLMNANLAYLGYVLIVFAAFNLIFLGGFFKTAYYHGKPFINFCIIAFILIGIAETIHHIPGFEFLNVGFGSELALQSLVLGAGIIVYITGTIFSMKKSIERFSQVDL